MKGKKILVMIFGVIIAIVFIVLISNFLKTKIAYGQIIKIDKVQSTLSIQDISQNELNITYKMAIKEVYEGSYVQFKYANTNDTLVLKDIKVIDHQKYMTEFVTNMGKDGASKDVLKNLGLSKLNVLIILLFFLNVFIFGGIFVKKKFF